MIATRAEAFQSLLLTLNTVKLSGRIRIYPYESSFVVMHTAGSSVLRVGCGLTTPVRGWGQKLLVMQPSQPHKNYKEIFPISKRKEQTSALPVVLEASRALESL